MSDPKARDREIGKDIADLLEMACEGQYPGFHVTSHYGIDHIIAAYREEIEAKKTVPIAMLREIANWEREDWTESLAIESIIARYGYEVTE